MPSRVRAATFALASSVIGLGCGSKASSEPPMDAAPIATAHVTIDPTRAAATPVPASFLGVSLEWNSVPQWLGDGAGARATTVALLKAFAAEGHTPQIRVGGNSEDASWWNPDAKPRPANVTYDITPTHLSTIAAVQSALGADVVLGLDLAWGDATNAAALVDAARAAMPGANVTFELGNEPDAYVPDHRSAYDWPTYRAEVDAFADGIDAKTSPPRFQWPALARPTWRDDLIAALSGEHDRFAVVSTHAYPYTACDGFFPPPPDWLLHDEAIGALAASFTTLADATHAAGFAYRMGEMNSVSCGGAAGLSDVYAAALWGAAVSMELAAIGVDGVNFHGGSPLGVPSYYAAFRYDGDGTLHVQPLYYGLRLVSLSTAAHGRIVPTSIVAEGATIRAYATLGDDGARRVLLIETSGSAAAVTLSGGAATSASLIRLSAPAIDAATGLSLGGATWDGSTDGLPRGEMKAEALARADAGWGVTLGGYEAVVVEMR